MKLIGLMVVRNEAWVLPASLPAALQWVDELVVLMHRCTDGTADFVHQFSLKDRVFWNTVFYHDDWDEASIRGEALNVGIRLGGTHFGFTAGVPSTTTAATIPPSATPASRSCSAMPPT
jgi:hypothetical protein